MSALDVALRASIARMPRPRFGTRASLVGLTAVVVGLVVVAPALVGFGVAVAAAVAWCIWLERHPEAPSNGDGRGPVLFSPEVSTQMQIARDVAAVSSLPARTTTGGGIAIILIAAAAAIGCDVNSALEQQSQARRLSAELLVQFTKAADSSNKAVMADADETSVAFARESEQAKQAVQTTIDALQPILLALNYSDEMRLLQEFVTRFAEYGELDRRILDLAVENTNVKAQRLSFGSGQEAADSFRDSLQTLVPLDAVKDTWRVKALVATAVVTVREIQVLQGPHIADADDAVMTRMEKSMATSEAAARSALATLAPLVQPESRPRLATASAALDRFIAVNSQITALSRRNTNVRSLALSLNQKVRVVGACEDSLRALHDALAKRGFTGTR